MLTGQVHRDEGRVTAGISLWFGDGARGSTAWAEPKTHAPTVLPRRPAQHHPHKPAQHHPPRPCGTTRAPRQHGSTAAWLHGHPRNNSVPRQGLLFPPDAGTRGLLPSAATPAWPRFPSPGSRWGRSLPPARGAEVRRPAQRSAYRIQGVVQPDPRAQPAPKPEQLHRQQATDRADLMISDCKR